MSGHGTYKTAAAMRAALETRINRRAREMGQDPNRMRSQAAFDRFLARLFGAESGREDFILKGGYAIELRFHRTRTTKDMDFCYHGHGPL